MHTALWVVQIVLALVFAAAGAMKLVRPDAALPDGADGRREVSLPLLRVVGAAELLGAAGMILPGITDLADWWTPWAAVGFMAVLLGALFVHNRRREFRPMYVITGLLALSLFVAWGRFVYEQVL